MPKKNTNILVISDLHCGHRIGLTHPDFQKRPEDKWTKARRDLWNWFQEEIQNLPTPDVLVVNGDAIEGKMQRSGGTEVLTTDRSEQCDMATRIIQEISPGSTLMIYGTGYHVGYGEDWEKQIADKVGAIKIGSQEWLDVNGTVFDFKHKVGGSSVPHTRATAVKRETLWNMIWAEHDQQPRADVLVRSHVHYCEVSWNSTVMAMTTPALQGLGTKYGARECSGHVDFGFVHFRVQPDGFLDFNPFRDIHLAKLRIQKARVLKI